jgi:hypothetical protein
MCGEKTAQAKRAPFGLGESRPLVEQGVAQQRETARRIRDWRIWHRPSWRDHGVSSLFFLLLVFLRLAFAIFGLKRETPTEEETKWPFRAIVLH